MGPKKRTKVTRNYTSETLYGGGPHELPENVIPTYRDIAKCYYFAEIAERNSNLHKISKQITEKLLVVWAKISDKMPLLAKSTIDMKVFTFLQNVKKINGKKIKARVKRNLDKKLDMIFDICKCNCNLEEAQCEDNNVKCKIQNCKKVHLICSCENKVPKEDRVFLKGQRKRCIQGDFGPLQFGGCVGQHSAKKSKQTVDESTVDSNLPLPAAVDTSCDSLSSMSMPVTDNSSEFEPDDQPKSTYSLMQFPKFAFELVRNEISSSVGAAIGNALLRDCSMLFKDSQIIDQITLDRSKIERQKNKVKIIAKDESKKTKQLACVGVDGKTDNNTLILKEFEHDGQKVMKKIIGKENHMVVTAESGEEAGQYLAHREIPTVGATGILHAQHLYEVLEEYDSLDTIEGILLDNTSVNTGHKTGLVTELEKKIGKKLHTIGCSLHQNELPLRAVFRNIDGTTKSPNHFSGPMGKLAEINHDMKKIVKFEYIKSPVQEMTITQNVIEDLSTDQRLFYEHVIGVSSGDMNLRFAHRKISSLNHARWLTLSIRLLSAYIRTENPPENLTVLVKYIQEVYAPVWFLHKKSNKLKDSPGIMLFMIKQMRLQDSKIRNICQNNLKNNAFCLLPENVLYSMLLDDDAEVRAIALNRIICIRDSSSTRRINKIMPINFDADLYWDLINIYHPDVGEPASTMKFSREELVKMLDDQRKPDLPIFPSHSQSVERAVKLVSEATQCVYGTERRHQHICGKLQSRKLRKSFSSKSYYEENYDDVL